MIVPVNGRDDTYRSKRIIEHIAGHKDRLIGKIQEKYGKSKWEAKRIEQELRTIDQTPRADETER